VSRPFIERAVSGAWEATRTYGVARGVSFAPKLRFRETWYNRLDAVSVAGGSKTVHDAVVGRPAAAGTLRFDTPLGGTDLTYSYAQRLKPGSFQQDAAAVDKGVEENQITVSDAFTPAPGLYARLSTGYDFRTFRTHEVGFRRRVHPFTADASWQAGRDLSFTVRDEYQLDEGNRAAILDARWGDEESSAAGVGFAWNRARSSNYVASADFAVAPSSPTWRLSVGVRVEAESERGVRGLHGFRVFEKEFAWTKRWHDFHTKLSGRVRPGGVSEFSVRVDLKFGGFDPKAAPRRDWEAEWFPDRAKSDELRP